MPLYAFEFMKKELGDFDIKDKNILLLGVSYRSNVGDTRYSPVERFYNYLKRDGANIYLHDPYVNYWEEVKIKVNDSLNQIFKSEIDIVIISTAHDEYKDNEYLIKFLNKKNNLFILDTVGLLNGIQIKNLLNNHKVRIIGRGDIT